MKKLNIGILGTRGIPNHYGGFEQFAEHLSYGLVQRGHDVSVYNSHLHPYKENYWNGVRIIHRKDMEHKWGTAGQFIYDLNCINDARKRNFDILLHLGYTSDSIWYWRWPRQTINMVNMDGMEWLRTKYSKPVKRFLKWAESLAAKHAQVMVADSPGVQEYISSKYGRKPTYIPYGADPFTDPDISRLIKYHLLPGQYSLMITRMEPENNVEMIIDGHLASGQTNPLFVIGNITNNYGKYITAKYNDQPRIKFSDAIYDQAELDNLRYYCSLYFHGHSVGGTNPSLLEAMACGCRIAAHKNQFNRAVCRDEAHYFPSVEEVTRIINTPMAATKLLQWKNLNMEKLRTIYTHERITDAYENLMLSACGQKQLIMLPATAEAV
jgi:glycosyltransferase involved in cell wall biosynthesis